VETSALGYFEQNIYPGKYLYHFFQNRLTFTEDMTKTLCITFSRTWWWCI